VIEKHLPQIVCCLTRAEAQRALLASIGHVAHLTFVSNRSAVRATVTRRAAVLVLAEIVDSLGSRLSSLLIQHWRDTLDVPVIAIVRAVPEEVRLITETVHAGIDEVIVLGIDDVAERILHELQNREAMAMSSTRDMLAGAVDAGTVALIETCVREAGQVSAHGLARSAGVSERTLTRRFALIGLPAPGTILRWVRVLLTLEELRHDRHSVTQAATHYGYSSNTAFRATLRQLTGMSPSEARKPHGYQRALAAFESILRRARQDRSAPVMRRARGGSAGSELACYVAGGKNAAGKSIKRVEVYEKR
jgi:AraC-like DNA-binding protein